MLVNQEEERPAMRFPITRASDCLILTLQHSHPKTQPRGKVWVGLNSSSFRHISTRRARKGKEVFPFHDHQIHSASVKSARQTVGHLQETSTFQDFPGGPSEGGRLDAQRERQGLAKPRFHPVVTVHLFLSLDVRGR